MDAVRDTAQRRAPVAHLATMSSGPGAIFALVLRNPSSCVSRKGKNRLLPACRMMASKPCACCSGRPLHGYYKHVWGLGLKWRLLLNAAKLQHGSWKSPPAICCGPSVGKQNFLRSPRTNAPRPHSLLCLQWGVAGR